MKIILVIAFLAFATLAYAQSSPEVDFVTRAYQIKYPKNWQPDSSRMMSTDVILFAPLENSMDKFRENVNVLVQNLAGQNINLEKYKQITDQQLQSAALDAKVVESVILTSGRERFYKAAYTMTQGKLRLRITSKCFIKNEKAYLVTFNSEIEKYDSYKKVGDEIVNSFKLRN